MADNPRAYYNLQTKNELEGKRCKEDRGSRRRTIDHRFTACFVPPSKALDTIFFCEYQCGYVTHKAKTYLGCSYAQFHKDKKKAK